MNINSISFGKKIPIAKSKVIDSKTDKLVPVTIYNIDCSDMLDVIYIQKACGDWELRSNIAKDMKESVIYNYFHTQNPDKKYDYYVLEKDQNNEILGMVETVIRTNDKNIKYIESRRDCRYKYVGQTIIGTLASKILKSDIENLGVEDPLPSAYSFYTKKCGFNAVTAFLLQMNKNKMQNFVDSFPKERKINLLDTKA